MVLPLFLLSRKIVANMSSDFDLSVVQTPLRMRSSFLRLDPFDGISFNASLMLFKYDDFPLFF